MSSAFARGLIFHGMKIPLYENIKAAICTEDEIKNTPLYKKMIAGVSSGALAITFATPAEGVKVKMQA